MLQLPLFVFYIIVWYWGFMFFWILGLYHSLDAWFASCPKYDSFGKVVYLLGWNRIRRYCWHWLQQPLLCRSSHELMPQLSTHPNPHLATPAPQPEKKNNQSNNHTKEKSRKIVENHYRNNGYLQKVEPRWHRIPICTHHKLQILQQCNVLLHSSISILWMWEIKTPIPYRDHSLYWWMNISLTLHDCIHHQSLKSIKIGYFQLLHVSMEILLPLLRSTNS